MTANTGVPATLTPDTSMICVGGANNDGSIADFTVQHSFLNVYALGNQIQWNDRPSDVSSGTSIASATVAGLAAYVLGTDLFKQRPNPLPIGQRGAEVRDWIIQKSWKRLPNGPAIIWNGFDYGSLKCSKRKAGDDPQGTGSNKVPNTGGKAKRDDTEDDANLDDACSK